MEIASRLALVPVLVSMVGCANVGIYSDVRVAARRVGMNGLFGAIRSLGRDEEGASECVAGNATFSEQ